MRQNESQTLKSPNIQHGHPIENVRSFEPSIQNLFMYWQHSACSNNPTSISSWWPKSSFVYQQFLFGARSASYSTHTCKPGIPRCNDIIGKQPYHLLLLWICLVWWWHNAETCSYQQGMAVIGKHLKLFTGHKFIITKCIIILIVQCVMHQSETKLHLQYHTVKWHCSEIRYFLRAFD